MPMTMQRQQLTQKEKMFLEDLKSHEEHCIEKYQKYADQTQSPELKQMFQKHGSQEQQHLNTLNQMLAGQIPQMGQQQGGGQQQMQTQQPSGSWQTDGGRSGQNSPDYYLCTDLLSTEKYVSHTYDTAIFEFTTPEARQALNHIQKEEQQHGEDIFLYMQSHGMYNPQ